MSLTSTTTLLLLACCAGASAQSTGIPANCISWNDGCNTCRVVNGVIGGCTMMMCQQQGSPFCVAYDYSSAPPSPPAPQAIAPAAAPTSFCEDSRPQMCRMMCQPPSCRSGQCAMRSDSCCEFTCAATTAAATKATAASGGMLDGGFDIGVPAPGESTAADTYDEATTAAATAAVGLVDAQSNNMFGSQFIRIVPGSVHSQIVAGTRYTMDIEAGETGCPITGDGVTLSAQRCPVTAGGTVFRYHIDIVDVPWQHPRYNLIGFHPIDAGPAAPTSKPGAAASGGMLDGGFDIGVSAPPAPPARPTIPAGCVSWHDGCNTCMVENGQISACTMMMCFQQATPHCLAFDRDHRH